MGIRIASADEKETETGRAGITVNSSTTESEDADKSVVATKHQSPSGNTKNPQLVDSSTQTQPPVNNHYCVDWCRHNGKQDDETMVRCGLCMHWHHVSCTESQEDAKYSKAAWTCPSCRSMPTVVSTLQANICKLINLPSVVSKVQSEVAMIVELLHKIAAGGEGEDSDESREDESESDADVPEHVEVHELTNSESDAW